MLILVDGYNVTMRDPALADRSKEAQRDALCVRLASLAPHIARGGRIEAVFDAHSAWGTASEECHGIKTVFAASADDEIVARCARQSGRVVVYTDDLRLRARISQDVGRRVEYRDVSTLWHAEPAGARRREGDVARETTLPRAVAKDITAELGELWLADEEE